jgi:hypothetical protein
MPHRDVLRATIVLLLADGQSLSAIAPGAETAQDRP